MQPAGEKKSMVTTRRRWDDGRGGGGGGGGGLVRDDAAGGRGGRDINKEIVSSSSSSSCFSSPFSFFSMFGVIRRSIVVDRDESPPAPSSARFCCWCFHPSFSRCCNNRRRRRTDTTHFSAASNKVALPPPVQPSSPRTPQHLLGALPHPATLAGTARSTAAAAVAWERHCFDAAVSAAVSAAFSQLLHARRAPATPETQQQAAARARRPPHCWPRRRHVGRLTRSPVPRECPPHRRCPPPSNAQDLQLIRKGDCYPVRLGAAPLQLVDFRPSLVAEAAVATTQGERSE